LSTITGAFALEPNKHPKPEGGAELPGYINLHHLMGLRAMLRMSGVMGIVFPEATLVET
jgi:hypothetical protein